MVKLSVKRMRYATGVVLALFLLFMELLLGHRWSTSPQHTEIAAGGAAVSSYLNGFIAEANDRNDTEIAAGGAAISSYLNGFIAEANDRNDTEIAAGGVAVSSYLKDFITQVNDGNVALTEIQFVSEFLTKHRQSKKSYQFVQIGASQGFEKNDPFVALKTSVGTYGYLVEPVPHNVEQMKMSILKRALGEQMIVQQAAVGCSENETTKPFYMVSEQYAQDRPYAPEWNKNQVNSFSRDHVYVHLCRPGAVSSKVFPEFWLYNNKICDASVVSSDIITSPVERATESRTHLESALNRCTYDKDCGAIVIKTDPMKGLTSTVSIGSVDCSQISSDFIKESSNAITYVKKDHDLDKNCKNDKYIVERPVRCLSAQHVLNEWLVSSKLKRQGEPLTVLDLLIVDTEGFDYEVLKSLELQASTPCTRNVCIEVIFYESIHLSAIDKLNSKNYLESHNYLVTELVDDVSPTLKMNTVAVSKTLLRHASP